LDYIKELRHIEYDRQALVDHFQEIRHRAKPYVERHTEFIPDGSELSPHFRCTCPACSPSGKHQHGEGHLFIRHVERYRNPEVLRLMEQLAYITQTSVPNCPVLWIYQPGFVLPPHRDFARVSSVIVPLTPATVTLYRDDLPVKRVDGYDTVEHDGDYVIAEHEYSLTYPTALHASQVLHGVRNVVEERVFLNFTGYCDWDDI
jgi:hypothetical protein